MIALTAIPLVTLASVSPTIWVSLISAAAAIACAWVAFRSSKSATLVESKKVDQAAYDRAVDFYTGQLDRVEKQVDRLNDQLERVSSQLQNEQSISATLRQQINYLERQVKLLQDTLRALKREPSGNTDPEMAPIG